MFNNRYYSVAVSLSMLAMSACANNEALDGEGTNEEVSVAEQAARGYFTVMSLNVRIPGDEGDRRWDRRLPRLGKVVAKWQPSVLGVQELTNNTYSDFTSRVVAGKSFWWYRVDRGDDAGESIVTYVDLAEFNVISHGFRNVYYPERHGFFCANISDDSLDYNNRPIQYVKLQHKESSKQYYYFNTHWPSRNSCERKEMAVIFATYIGTINTDGLPVIAAGDFNDGYNPDGTVNESIAYFLSLLNNSRYNLRSSYFEDIYNSQGSAGRYITSNVNWNKVARTGKMIDHIMESDGLNGVQLLPFSSRVDRSMFDSTDPNNPTLIDCETVTSSGLCSGTTYYAKDLSLYSDHWSVVTRFRH